jgi:Flp pilus assembly protein TadG
VVRHNRQKGFILIAMSVCMFLLLAVVGMAFDMGRIYIARNEAQIFTDAAAMAAAKQLDGTGAGLDRARAAVAAMPNRWNLGTENFTGVVTEFSTDGRQWDAQPKDAKDVAGLHFARVTAPDNHVEIIFLRAVGGPQQFTVPARAVASIKPVRLTQ